MQPIAASLMTLRIGSVFAQTVATIDFERVGQTWPLATGLDDRARRIRKRAMGATP
jgi:hypothetical protein